MRSVKPRDTPVYRHGIPCSGILRRAFFQLLEFRVLLIATAAGICSGNFEARAADLKPKVDPLAVARAGLSATNAAQVRCKAADYFRQQPKAADADALNALAEMLADERRVQLETRGYADGLPGSPAGEAAKALEAIGAPAAPMLRMLATNAPVPLVRERSVRALGRMGDHAAMAELLVSLADTNRGVSLAASDALASFGTNVAPALRNYLAPENPPNADRALWVLGQLHDIESLSLMMRYVISDDTFARLSAGSALAKLGTDGAQRLLNQWKDADEAERLKMIPALDKLATPETREHLLLIALADRSYNLRAAALRDMAGWNDEVSPVAMMCSVRGADGINREEIRKNFSQLGAPAAKLLLTYLDDDNPVIWQSAALSLAAMSKEAARPLFDSLRDPSRTREVKRRTAWVLMNLGDLKTTYDDSQRLWIAADDWQMLSIFTEGIPAPLAEATESTYPSQRSGALRTMSVLKLRGAESYLLRALDDRDPDVVQTARRGLAEQGYAFSSELETVVQHSSVRASRAAAQALSDIDYRPRTQAMSVEFFASRDATDRLLELGGAVPTHLERRLERCTEAAEITRLALDLSRVLPMIPPDERFAVDNVMVRLAFYGSNRTARINAAKELSGRANLLLALALDTDTNVAAAAMKHLAALPGNASDVLSACLRSGEQRLREVAFAVLRETEPTGLSEFEWTIREPDPAVVREAAALFAARGHEPSNLVLRAEIAVQNQDWPRAFALGTNAIASLRSYIENMPLTNLPPLFNALADSGRPEFVDLLVNDEVLHHRAPMEAAWPAIEKAAMLLEPRLLNILHSGDLDSANAAAEILVRTQQVPDDHSPDFVLFCGAAGLTRELDDRREEAMKLFMAELKSAEPARRLRGAVWLTLMQRDPDRESLLSIAGLVRGYIYRLDHGEPFERAEAAVLLAQFGTNAAPAVPALVRTLGDSTALPYRSGIVAREALETPAQAAAFALGKIGSPAVEALLRVWDSTDTPDDVRKTAAYALSMQRDPRCARVQLQLLENDRRVGVQMEAIRSLAISDPKGSVKPLLRIITHAYDKVIISTAAEALRKIGPEANPILTLALYDEDSTMQETALTYLTQRSDPSAFEAAMRLARSPYARVRSQAAKYFGSINQPRAISMLAEMLGDRSTLVQWNAAEALDTYGAAVVGSLVERMPAADPELRQRMVPLLRSATGEDFGFDADAWQAWWKKNGAKSQ